MKRQISIKKFNQEDFSSLYDFMRPIWLDTYSFLPIEQVQLLLDKYFSSENLLSFVASGYEYYWIDDCAVLVIKKQDDYVYIDKLYLLPSCRGKGYPTAVFDWLLQFGKPLVLNVNVNNERAVKCYLKNGFKVVEEVVIELGNGLINRDYVMRKEV